MASAATNSDVSYSLGAVSRLTGLSGHVLRAWERRYGAIRPRRTAGGTRRYNESDLARLLLLRATVDAGHPIGTVAGLSDEELRVRAGPGTGATPLPLRALINAVERLDADELDRLLGLQLAALGTRRFATQVAAPLLREVGAAWATGRLPIAAEHLASAQVRSLLGVLLLQHTDTPATGAVPPPLVFATLAGERHELGVLIAAVCAAEAGAQVVYLGADLPSDQIVHAAERSGARAVVLGLVERDLRQAGDELLALRRALPRDCALWVGGSGASEGALPDGIERVPDVESLEARLAAGRA